MMPKISFGVDRKVKVTKTKFEVRKCRPMAARSSMIRVSSWEREFPGMNILTGYRSRGKPFGGIPVCREILNFLEL